MNKILLKSFFGIFFTLVLIIFSANAANKVLTRKTYSLRQAIAHFWAGRFLFRMTTPKLGSKGLSLSILFLGLFGFFFQSNTLFAQNPGGVSGSNLWLKANEGATNSGTTLTGWADQTGTNTFTVNGTINYSANSINFNPVVSIDNTQANTSLPGSYLAGNTSITAVDAFAVLRKTNANSGALVGSNTAGTNYGQAIFSGESSTGMWVGNGTDGRHQHFTNSGVDPGNLALINMDVSLSASPFATARLNGESQTIIPGAQGDFTQMTFTPWIGGTNNNGSPLGWRHFRGEVAEIVLYPTSLPASDKLKIESYLAIKYGITLDATVTNYVSSAGTVLWNNTSYWNDVFGIGKDDGSGLNQTSSNSINTGSGDGTGQSGKGNIVLSNASSLDDGDFLMLGHDNAALTEQTSEVPLLGQRRVAREWFVKRTGDPGTVDLRFDILGLGLTGTAAADFKLLIDADGDFTSGAITVDASSLTGTEVAFTGVIIPDGSYLTIVTNFLPPVGPGVLGASLWLKADDGASNSGSNLTGWTDQTGINTFTVNGAPGYASNEINFNPVAVFDNDEAVTDLPGDYLAGNASISYVDGFAVFFKTNAASGALIGSATHGVKYGQQIFGGFSGNENYISNAGATDPFFRFENSSLGALQPATVVGVDLNYTSATTGELSTLNGLTQTIIGTKGFNQMNLTPWIGGTNNQGGTVPNQGWRHFRGKVAELILYPSSLTLAEKLKIQSYLAIKYGISLDASVTNYVSSAGTVLWNNTTYWHDVFGIGRDDASGLNQTQSNSINTGSGDGTGQSGKGNLVVSNVDPLTNGQFFLLGHNNAPLTEKTTEVRPGMKRLSREWLIQSINPNEPTDGRTRVNLSFDISGLNISGTKAEHFKLNVTSTRGGGLANPSAFNGTTVKFDGISLSNGDIITLVTHSPGPGVEGAGLWLVGDDVIELSSGSLSGRWPDRTITNEMIYQGNLFTRPAVPDINFHKTVDFDGNDYLGGTYSITFQTLYAVVKHDRANGNEDAIIGTQQGGRMMEGFELNSQPSVSGDWNFKIDNGPNQSYFTQQGRLGVVNIVDGQPIASQKIYLDGTSYNASGLSTSNPISFTGIPEIGRFQGDLGQRFFDGQIAEVIMYPTAHTDEERNKVQSYLAIKYGITLDPSIGSYVNSSGNSIWNHAAYWHDVFGIGKDNGNGLDQAQSNSINTGSGNGTGQSGKGNIVLRDATSLDDGDFLVIGHDNQELSPQFIDLPSGLLSFRIKREWKVQRTGDPGTVTLEFNFLDLLGNNGTSGDYLLLIDEDGNGDFTNGTVTQIPATSYVNNIAKFTNVNLPDGAVFTFTTAQTKGPGVLGTDLWVKANEGVTLSGNNLSAWTDQAGINTFSVNGTVSLDSNAVNFNPAVDFTNTNSSGFPENSISGNTSVPAVEVFGVFKYKSLAEQGTILGSTTDATAIFGGTFNTMKMGNGTNNQIYSNPLVSSGFSINSSDFSPSLANVRINGASSTVTQDVGVDFSEVNLNVPLIGGSQSQFNKLNGQLAELIVYPSSLSDANRGIVESYLAIKYGITLDSAVGKYVNAAGTTLWDNATYWNDVFGIGKEDASGLNQVASNSINTGSGDGTGQSGKGNIVVSNPSSLDDGDFLLMGHDNGNLAEQSTEVPVLGWKRLGREWQVKRTGDPGSVNLSFDISGLTLTGNKATQYILLVDTDSDFSTGATEIRASALSGNKVEFDGVSLPDGAFFTLVTYKVVDPGVADASLWLKADQGVFTSGSTLTNWIDQTGINQFTVAGNPGSQVSAINFNPSVIFTNNSGTLVNLPVNRLTGDTRITYVDGFAVYKLDPSRVNGLGTLIGGTDRLTTGQFPDDNYGKAIFSATPQDGPNKYTVYAGTGIPGQFQWYDNTTIPKTAFAINNLDVGINTSPFATGRINGKNQTIQAGGQGDFSSIDLVPMIGGTTNFYENGWNPFAGQVTEIVLFDRSLTSEEKLKVESYLAVKYGITLDPSVTNYLSSTGAVLWNSPTYWHDVFGLGKDDANGLNQTRSNSINTGSGDGTGQSGKGNIVLSNASSLDNGDFILIGHDNAPLTEQITDLPNGLQKLRLSREWKVKRTGDPGTVSLAFNTLGLTLSSSSLSQLILLIDEDGNGDFTNGPVTQVTASTFANNVITFDGVGLADNVVFTIITGSNSGPAVKGAELWLKGDSGVNPGSGTLTQWTDQTGFNNFSVSGDPQTGTSAFNFNNAIDFDGSGDYLTGDEPITFQTLYAVIKRASDLPNDDLQGVVVGAKSSFTDPTRGVGVIMQGNYLTTLNNEFLPSDFVAIQSDGGKFGSSLRLGVVEIVDGPFDQSKSFVDGTFYPMKRAPFSLAQGTLLKPYLAIPFIGRQFQSGMPYYFKGQIAELIMYPASHTPAERNIIESYLAVKYGITLDPFVGQYVNSSGNTIWNNTAYWHDVFGIGKDDGSGLNQPSSNSINTGSGDGTGQSGKGNIVLSNPTSLDAGDFLMIGHDDGALTTQTSDLPASLGAFRLTREWKVKRTGDPGSLDLVFDLAGLTFNGTQASDFKLVIDPDGDGNFTTGTPTVIDASGFVSDRASFTGVSLPDNSVFTLVTGPGNPEWKLEKVARVTSFNRVGQTLVYQFLVTNTGNVNITNVSVFDETLNKAPNLLDSPPTRDGVLNPGEVWEYATVYRTTQADLDRGFFTNIARATGNSAAGAPPVVKDTVTVNAVQIPSFSFEKKALNSTYGSVNDPITYQLILKNTGNVTLSNSTISDPLLGLNQTIAQAIAPGDSVVVSGNYKVTQADLDAGEVINTATATAEGPSGALPAVTDTETVTANQSPSWRLSKTSDKSTYSKVGEVITYTFTLTNTGNVSISSVSLSDNKVSPAPALQSESLSPADNVLSPGESFVYTASYAVTQADIDAGSIVNTATASGTPPSGAPSLADATASDTVTAQSNPSIRISKTADKSTFELLGEVITYTLEIENTGNVTLDQLVVQDNLTSFSSGTPFSLVPAGVRTFTTTYTVSQQDLDAGEIINNATVAGEAPSNNPVNSSDDLTLRAKIAGALNLEKTANPTVFVNQGEVVTYTFVLTNTGNVTLSNIVLDDPRINFNQAVPDLAPGQATSITHSYTLTQADINAQVVINTATATATTPLGKSVTASDVAYVTAEDKGALDINKVAVDKTYTQVGEVIDFEITVTNVGNVTIDNVVVTDALTSLNVNVGTLSPGQSSSVIPTSYTIQQGDLDAGQVLNTATVNGVESTPQATPVSAKDDAVSFAKIRDVIKITKVAQTPDFDSEGDILTYELTVENLGNVTLTNVVVSDPLATVVNPNVGTLLPGQPVTINATYTVQQADVDRGSVTNIASVTGTDPFGSIVSDKDQAIVQGIQNPSISLTKTGVPTLYSAVGETITYTLEVTNTGNVSLTNVVLVDSLTNTNQTVSASLAPNQTVSITETYTVNQQDIDRGSIVNTATLTALDPAGQSQQTQAGFTVTATQNPQLSFNKSADKTDYDSLGELITYELIVSNPGNVTLKNVIVTDPLTGLNSNIGEIGPGQNRTIRTSHLVTQAELDAGTLTNTATVIASPPTGTPLSQQSSVTLNAIQNPSVDIQKNALTQSYSAVGDVLDYEIIVTNTGNVTLDNVTVQDPLVSINQNLGTLAPGSAQTLTGSYAVQQADLDVGSVVNVAVLEAIDPNSNTLNGQATATVSAVATPSIAITKTANKQNFQSLGEQITYTFTVENTGNVTLSNVVVSDAKANFTSNPPSTLLPGSTGIFITTYTVTQADLDAGEIVNISSVSGEDPFATSVQSADTLKVPALQNKALELRKTASTTLFNAAGEVVTYNFQVTNIGNVTLNNVVINDPRIPFNQAVGALAPNQAAQFSTNYTLTQADVDSLRVVNVATATGTAPDNSMVTTTDNNTITIAGVGALQLDKTAIQKTYNAAGDVLDFELKVTNTGTVTIDNIRLTDGPTGIVDLDLGSLAPGASTVIPTSYTVSQADIDAGQFQNVAFVQGVENTPQARTVSAQDAVIILATTNASVKLDKVDLTKTFDAVGTTLNYQLVVTNNGNVTLTNIQLTDPLTGLNQTLQNIAPGQSRTITTSYIIKQADLDSGRVTNVATVDASTFGNQAVQDSDQVISQAVQKPVLLVTKTADVSNFDQVGDLITYTIEVTNSGNVTLTNVIATDPLTNTNQNLGNLAPGQKASITEKYQVTQADIDAGKVVNTVAVTGLDPKGSTISGTASNTVFADQNPGLELTKTATPNTFDQVGDVITYQLVVRNTGNVTLTKTVVTDPLTGFNVNLDTLAVGASKTLNEVFTISQQDIDRGFVLNTANSQALDPNAQKVSATANARVDAVQNPGIGLKKTTTTPTYGAVGDVVEFEIEVTNTGNETLTNVTVVDPLTNLNQNIGTLSPTQSQTITTSYVINQADLDAGKVVNTASVSGTDPSSQIIQANSGSQATALQNPSVSLTKTPSQSTYSQNGESITFDLLVENTGNVTLTNVVIKDPLTGLNQTVATLAPGQSTSLSTSYSVTQQDLDKGQFVNTGIVEASAPGGVTVSDSQSATITATVNASVEITKSATPTTYSQVGDVIRYVLKVTNTGNVTTNTIRVVDPLTGLDRNLGILSPKKTLTLNESYTITQQDIDRGQVVNTATVTAESPAGAPIQDDASATVTAVQDPGINLVKTTNTPIYNQAGDLIDFTLKVTNTGNETLFKVKVIDPLTGLNQTIGTLSPGQSISISTSYTATQADVDLGQINNSATVSGFDPSNKKVESTAQSIATASQNAAISVTKTATPIDYDQVGDVITYQIVVTNSGNLTLTNVTVSDPLTNTNQTITSLLPSQKVTITERYTVTQRDIDAGQVINTVDVSGTDPNGLAVQAAASATAFAVQNPGIGLIKTTVAPGTYTKVGDVVEFELIAENTGNETLTNVIVVDPLTGLNQVIGTLTPGQRSSLTTSYSVSQADIDQGIITNTATVTGVDPNNQTLTAGAASLANALINSGIALEKTTQATGFSQLGELIPYEIKVENTGNTTLNTISISDPILGLTQFENTIDPGQVNTITRNYTVTQADLDAGFILNIAEAKGIDPFNTLENSIDSVRINAIQSPGISISKTPSQPDYSSVSEVIDYELIITNTGNVTLSNLVVTDPLTNLNQALSDLIPGETVTISTSYSILQTDLDAGRVVNTATVTGTDPNQQTQAATASATATAVQNPGIGLIKSVDKKEYSQAGEVLTYTLTVENTGNETLTNVTVSDPLTGLTQNLGTLTPGQNQTVTTSYTVTQADVDGGQVLNTGSVSGTDPNQTVLTADAQTVSNAVQTPGITLNKAVLPGTYDQVGDVLTYTLTVENTGNVTLENVTVVDPLTNLSQSVGTLTPGQQSVLNEQYTVTQSDVDNGQVVNTATVTGTDPNQQTQTATASATATAVQNPGIGLIKSVDKKEYSQAGEVLTYTLTVENTGNETLTNVTVSDPLTGLTQSLGTLTPGQNQTVTTSYTVSQTDLDQGQVLNTGNVTGEDPNQTVLTADAQTVSNAVQTPGITLSKAVLPGTYDQVGDVLTYTLTVENTGNVTLENVTVVDPLTNLSQNAGTLTPGGKATLNEQYTVTQSDLDNGQVVNTATVTGTDPSQQVQTATASATATAVQNPGIGLIKSVDKKEYSQAGEVLTYTLTVENTGNETLTNVTVSDPLTGLTQNVGTLTPGQNQTVTTSYTVTQADVDGGQVLNTASVTGEDPNQTVLTADAQTVSNAVQTPGITLSKTVIPSTYDQVGDVLTYTLTVENTGNVTLENVTVVDPLTNLSQNVGSLLPGGKATLNEQYVVTQADLDQGQVVNKAMVTATDPNQQTQTATASATATAVQNPGIALIKSVDKKEYSQAGEVLTYTLTVENTGNETLDNVTVTDPLTGLTQNVGTLSPGQSQTVTTSYTVTQTDVDGGQVLNTGSVTGEDPNKTVLAADAQTVSNAVQTPGITLSKTVIPGTYDQVGDVLTYTIKVENSGNVTLTDITINDPLTGLSQTFTTLAPGKTLTLNEQYTVTQSDLDNGQVVNTATVTGTDPSQQVQTATASATATAVQNPGIALIKSVDKKEYSQAGEVLTYTLTVENTGNETLDNVTVSDPLTGLTQNVGTLTPGQNQTVTTSYTVTQADVDGGQVLNTASVSGTDPNQTVITADAQTVSFAIVNADAELIKTAIQTSFSKVGDVLSYELVLTNKGNVTLTNITVEDPATGLSEFIDELSVNESITIETNYTITEEDIQRGFFTNIAFAKGTYLGTDLIEANGSATSQFVPTEIIAVDDDFGVFPLSFAGTLGNVLNNDLVDGEVPNPTEVFVEIIESGNLQGVSFDLEGNLILIPGLNEPGIYQLTYRLSEVGVPENYDEAIITIELEDDRVDLSIQKVTLVSEIYEGDEFEYEVTIQNLGETAARNVVIRDELPGGVGRIGEETVQVSDPQIEINPSVIGSVLTWEIPFFPSGAEIVIRIKVKAGNPGLITNGASVLSEGIDTDPSNNQSSVTDEIKAFKVPNVITPNSDGLNDEFQINGLNKFVENKLVIINRAGDVVFEQNNYLNNWSAEGLQAGTYFYVLEVTDASGRKQDFKGWVQVIKK